MNELQQILEHINNRENFLLSGGAGSGKTYTLVEVIRAIIEKNPSEKIACMTYTNAAVKEIEERVNHQNLTVSTYHDFLWDIIKHFKKELKLGLIALANDEAIGKIIIDEPDVIPNNYFDHLNEGIQYKEYVRIKEGIISHDEIIILANYIFQNYPKICDILKDKFPFILIDEYQDTQREVVQVLLDHLTQSNKKNVIGFFGDAMQAIYPEGIGDLNDYVGTESGEVFEVLKEQNRRNPQKVIDLANLIRTDGLIQEPSNDPYAPNMVNENEVKEGEIKFIYSSTEDITPVRAYLGWDFHNTRETKELNLTHNLIAGKAGFNNLMDIYNNDRILEYKNLVRRFIREHNIDVSNPELTFGDILDKQEINVARPPRIQSFIEDNLILFEFALSQKWEVFSKIYIGSEQLIDDKKQSSDEESKKGSKRDNLIKHLFKIQNSIHLYNVGNYNEFLKKTELKVNSINDKKILKNIIEEFNEIGAKTIEEVINLADEKGICIKDDKFERYIEENEYVYLRIKNIPFSEFQDLFKYLEGYTPFSTQHKTKGSEFDNVLVILDNGRWNQYNFTYLFTGNGNPTVLERTQKIFYTCCTRAKEKLAVFFHNPSAEVLIRAEQWFGEENVIKID